MRSFVKNIRLVNDKELMKIILRTMIIIFQIDFCIFTQ